MVWCSFLVLLLVNFVVFIVSLRICFWKIGMLSVCWSVGLRDGCGQVIFLCFSCCLKKGCVILLMMGLGWMIVIWMMRLQNFFGWLCGSDVICVWFFIWKMLIVLVLCSIVQVLGLLIGRWVRLRLSFLCLWISGMVFLRVLSMLRLSRLILMMLRLVQLFLFYCMMMWFFIVVGLSGMILLSWFVYIIMFFECWLR